MKRSLLAMLVALSLAVGLTGVAWAALTSIVIKGGDSVSASCAGRSMGMSRSSTTVIVLRCRPSATPTTTSPSSTPTSPSSTPTSPSSTPTNTGGFSCVTSSPSGNCGAYDYAGITNSNGYNTYVANNCWGDPTCKQTVRANSPGDWEVTSTEPAGSGAVATYPDVQQLTNNWGGSGFNGFSDTPMAALTGLSSTYAETTPHDSGMIAQAAYDVWVGNAGANSDEIMVWVDNANRDPEDAGATFDSQQTIAGQTWSLYFYGGHGGETIWSLGARHAAAQQGSGTVDIKALFDSLVAKGYQNANAALGQIDFGWEVCSTGGVAKTFTVSNYTLTFGT